MSQSLSPELLQKLNQEAEQLGITPSEFLETLLNYYMFFENGHNALFSPTLDRQFQSQITAALKKHEGLLAQVKDLKLK